MKLQKLYDKTDVSDLIIERGIKCDMKEIDIVSFDKALKTEEINGEKIIHAFESTNFGYLVTATKVYRC